MFERPTIDNDTPLLIDKWLKSPYNYFGNKFKSNNLLDVGCGENDQLNILNKYFDNVTSIDKEKLNKTVKKIDVFEIQDIYNTIFCFEVIEHIPRNLHKKLIEHLYSICDNDIVIGSVNLSGPKNINNIEIYTGEKNPYHIAEYNLNQWEQFFIKFNYDITFFHNIFENNQFIFKHGLSTLGISNYVHIKKENK